MGWFSDFFSDPIGTTIGTLGQIGQAIIDVTVDAISEVVSWFIDVPDMDDLEAQYAGVLVNKMSNIASIPVVYGQRKIGGVRVFVATSGTDNTYLYLVLALCEGEIHSIGDVYINDTISTDSKFSGLLTINKYTGSDGQDADSTLVGANVGWTSSHRLRGVAYIAAKIKWDQDVFGGIPSIHAVVQGRKVYDPRASATASVANSSNPALCLREFLTNSRYGKGLDSSFLNDSQFITAANKCDSLVTSYAGSSNQKIFECNAVVDTNKTLIDNVKVLLSSMRGLMPYHQGQYGILVEDEGSATFSFTESHIIGGISIRSESKKTKFNRVIATFANPNANWQMDQIEYPVAGSAEEAGYLLQDGGVELVSNINLPATSNIYTAQDIASIALKRSRNSLMVSFTATSEALNVSVGDIVGLTHSTPGWEAKTFRVQKLTLGADGTVIVSLVEHQDSIYPWSEKTEADDIPDTNLPNPFNVAPAGIPSVQESLYVTKNGAGVKARVDLNWQPADDAFVNKYEVQYKGQTASNYSHAGTVSDTSLEILDIAPGSYYFRVRAGNTIGANSSWSETGLTEIFGLAEKPSTLTNFAAQNVSSLTILTWDQSVDIDVRIGGHIEVRHSSLTSSAGWSDSVSVGNSILNGTATVAVLPFQPGTYIIRATDSSGIQSDTTSITTLGDTVQAFSSVGIVQAHPSFPGSFDDVIKLGSIIKLEGQNNIDAWSDIDSVVLFDIGDAGIDLGGTYTFSSGIDAGSVKRQQIKRHIKSVVTQPLDLVDSRSVNIDDWDDWDGTNTANGDCKVYVRHTEDNPSSTPTWSGWELLNVNEYNKRAFQFKAVLSVNDSAYNIEISELSVTAQEIA